MFLRKVGEKWVFFFKNKAYIEKNLAKLGTFLIFWPKKWLISEKEFGSQNVGK